MATGRRDPPTGDGDDGWLNPRGAPDIRDADFAGILVWHITTGLELDARHVNPVAVSHLYDYLLCTTTCWRARACLDTAVGRGGGRWVPATSSRGPAPSRSAVRRWSMPTVVRWPASSSRASGSTSRALRDGSRCATDRTSTAAHRRRPTPGDRDRPDAGRRRPHPWDVTRGFLRPDVVLQDGGRGHRHVPPPVQRGAGGASAMASSAWSAVTAKRRRSRDDREPS